MEYSDVRLRSDRRFSGSKGTPICSKDLGLEDDASALELTDSRTLSKEAIEHISAPWEGQLLQLERHRIADALRTLRAGSHSRLLLKALFEIGMDCMQDAFLEDMEGLIMTVVVIVIPQISPP